MLYQAIASIENEDDRSFVEDLYRANYALMLYRALGLMKNRPDAEDVVETVMLRLIERMELLKECNRDSITSYLLCCVRNEAYGRFRRDKRRCDTPAAREQLEQLSDGEDVDVGLIREAEVSALIAALKRLPERERTALQMKYYDKMGDGEIGELLGLSRSGARAMMERARRKVAVWMREVEA